MLDRVVLALILVLLLGLFFLLLLHHSNRVQEQAQTNDQEEQPIELENIPLDRITSLQLENLGNAKSLNVQPTGFVPVEARIVPSHASYSNKFNDQIGTLNAEVISYGTQEVVIPSDWYMKATPPTEFDGPYWPSGRIQPEFPAAQPDWVRPLRSQNASASYSSVPSN